MKIETVGDRRVTTLIMSPAQHRAIRHAWSPLFAVMDDIFARAALDMLAYSRLRK